MTDEAGEIEIVEGMPIKGEDGTDLGQVAGMLVDEEEDEIAFLILAPAGGGAPRIAPVETLTDHEEGRLVLALTPQELDALPEFSEDRDPTEQEIERAYEVAGLR